MAVAKHVNYMCYITCLVEILNQCQEIYKKISNEKYKRKTMKTEACKEQTACKIQLNTRERQHVKQNPITNPNKTEKQRVKQIPI